MLHSGSRNIGKELAERHMAVAREAPAQRSDLPDRDLAVFLAGTPEMDAYRRDLYWAQEYAARNRAAMLALLLQGRPATRCPTAASRSSEPISCHHNYVAEEIYDGETCSSPARARSGPAGATSASSRDRWAPVRTSSAAWATRTSFNSASHGAGRTDEPHQGEEDASPSTTSRAQTAGVECRKDAGVVDEIPGAYKDIEQVIEAQADLVEVVAHLKQVVCVKG